VNGDLVTHVPADQVGGGPAVRCHRTSVPRRAAEWQAPMASYTDVIASYRPVI
jgi:hypothetical protein